jgi:surface antigen
MKTFLLAGAAAVFLAGAGTALADPIQINDDEGYSRLARWENHLDDRIAQRVQNRSLDGYHAWQIQKQLDDVEQHVLQSYYVSDNGIQPQDFRRYADQLRRIGGQLGDNGWREESFNDSDNNRYNGGGYQGGYQQGGYQQGGYDQGPPPGPPPGNYYQQGRYESDCHRGNAAAGTIFGAIAGGLIGGAASHGNGGAVAGGVIVGGLLGNALSQNIDCDDQRYAYASYNEGLNGDLYHEYRWNHDGRYGTFEATREYRENGRLCRDFHVVNYRNGQRFEHDGTACREPDNNWHFR